MWNALGIQPIEVLYVTLGAIGIYMALVVLIRIMGQRSVSSLSNIDTAALIVIGSVGGRAVLGYVPTLAGGIVAFLALFCTRIVVAQIRRRPLGRRLVANRPVLLMAAGEIIESNLNRTHILPSELYAKMRAAGVGAREDVACAVLEPSGLISVLRRGTAIDPAIMASVDGHEHIPQELYNAK